MLGIESRVGVWVVAAVAVVLALAFIARTIVSVRLIARRPAASIEALRLHDRAAGSVGRAVVVATWLALTAPGWWGWWRLDGDGWPVAIVGVVTVIALIVIEQRWPVPGGTVRSASLQRRRLGEVLPRGGTAIAGIGLLIAVGSIVTCGLMGGLSPAIADSASGTAGFSWPGWRWSAPLLGGLGGIALAVWVAVRLLLRRPALAGFDRSTDLTYRRSGVDRLLRIVAFYGFWSASLVLNEVKNVSLEQASGLVSAWNWSSAALLLAGLVSIELLRVHPPQRSRPTGVSAPAPATR